MDQHLKNMWGGHSASRTPTIRLTLVVSTEIPPELRFAPPCGRSEWLPKRGQCQQPTYNMAMIPRCGHQFNRCKTPKKINMWNLKSNARGNKNLRGKKKLAVESMSMHLIHLSCNIISGFSPWRLENPATIFWMFRNYLILILLL